MPAPPTRSRPACCATRTAALPAFAGRQGPGDGSHDDPAGLVHDEAQRHRRDDSGDLAGVLADPSAGAGRPGAGLQGTDRHAGSDAGQAPDGGRLPRQRADLPPGQGAGPDQGRPFRASQHPGRPGSGPGTDAARLHAGQAGGGHPAVVRPSAAHGRPAGHLCPPA
ncbi:hypothetical protein G6F66_014040 [Rhizopus arrhizus]|nr:hypothetical protein G6F66_014040 [Rhizopus arrhizus]